MGGYGTRGTVLVPLFAFVACQSPRTTLDLRENAELYRSPDYRSRMAVDRAVFIAPLVDERHGGDADADTGAGPDPSAGAGAAAAAEAAEAGSGPYPIQWMPEGLWDRPLVQMIEDIVVDEVRDSGVFKGVQRHAPPDPDVLVLKAYLLEARCGVQEHPAGRRTIGDVAMRVVVYGPDRGRSGRPILWERAFRQPVQSEVAVRPPSAPSVLGLALRGTMQKLLAAVDQSNVARSGVPIDASGQRDRSGR